MVQWCERCDGVNVHTIVTPVMVVSFFYVSNPPDYTYTIYNPIYNNINQHISYVIHQDHWSKAIKSTIFH